MRYPKDLPSRGTVGFVAPSYGAVIEPYHSLFESFLKRLQEEGYKTEIGPNVFASHGVGKSATPKECADELTDFYQRNDIDILMSVGGGETMCEDLSFLNFEKIRSANPKWYIGYSDNTNFTFLLPTLCDTVSIYGPCAGDFGALNRHPALEDSWNILTGKSKSISSYDFWEPAAEKEKENVLAPYNACRESRPSGINWDGEPFSGRLLGGCLDLFSLLCGTKFDRVKEFEKKYEEDGIIWFLESCELTSVSVRRVLWQLKEAGWFRTAKGFLIGRPMMYEDETCGLTQTCALDILKEFNVPILTDLDIGHLPPAMPMVTGSIGTVSLKQKDPMRITVDFEYR